MQKFIHVFDFQSLFHGLIYMDPSRLYILESQYLCYLVNIMGLSVRCPTHLRHPSRLFKYPSKASTWIKVTKFLYVHAPECYAISV